MTEVTPGGMSRDYVHTWIQINCSHTINSVLPVHSLLTRKVKTTHHIIFSVKQSDATNEQLFLLFITPLLFTDWIVVTGVTGVDVFCVYNNTEISILIIMIRTERQAYRSMGW